MARMLESEEAARRLGVKVSTLYAYVSRGLLRSHPAPGSRRSLFELDEVEALARRARTRRPAEARLATVTTAVTQLRDDGPAYRGQPATVLAGSATYESVADLLWSTPPSSADDWQAAPGGPAPPVQAADRLCWATVMAGAADPLRADDRPEAVVRAARRVVATMLASLSGAPAVVTDPDRSAGGRPASRTPSVATRLTRALQPATAADCEAAVDAALVLMADHELATSTVAVRVAASTRADLYHAVLSGLGTMAGPLHGGASLQVHRLLEQADVLGPERACNDALRFAGQLPGVGHTVYRHGDPRLAPLWEHVRGLADARQSAVLDGVRELVAATGLPAPNIDLGLGALTWVTGMPADGGPTIFTVARVAGWTAHYLEELGERPLRFRARAVYVTPGP